MLVLRPMSSEDLSCIEHWLSQPHVARWWTSTTTAGDLIALYQRRVTCLDERTHMLMVSEDGRDVGWCQWYRWSDYPEESRSLGAHVDDVGIDYAIGDLENVRRGVGTLLVAAVVEHVRSARPGAGVVVDIDASNAASRRVLEKNGFICAGRPVSRSSDEDSPRILFRLDAPPVHG